MKTIKLLKNNYIETIDGAVENPEHRVFLKEAVSCILHGYLPPEAPPESFIRAINNTYDIFFGDVPIVVTIQPGKVPRARLTFVFSKEQLSNFN